MTVEDWLSFVMLSLIIITLGVEAVENPYRNNKPLIVTVVCIMFIVAVFFVIRHGYL